jgi:hypothetical protein
MEALAAVGFANSIIQFIDFGTRLCARIREYSSAANGIPKKLLDLGERLSYVLDTIKSLAEGGLTKLEHEEKTLQACLKQAKEIDTLLDSFKPPTLAGVCLNKLNLDKAWAAFKSLRGESKIDAMQLTLHRLLELAGFQVQIQTATAVDSLNLKMDSMILNENESECFPPWAA